MAWCRSLGSGELFLEREEADGGLYAVYGVFAIAVGAHLVGEFAGDGRSANHDADFVAESDVFEVGDGASHVGHGGGEECGHADDLGFVLHDGVGELFGGGVDSEVVDDPSGASEHHDAEVLADVVEVAFDGAHDYGADGFDAGRGEDGFEVGHAGLHGAGGDEDFGDEDDVVAEFDADDGHAVEESVVEDVVGGVALVEALFGEAVDFEVLADDELVCDLLHHLVSKFEGFADVFLFAGPGDPFELALQTFVDDWHG